MSEENQGPAAGDSDIRNAFVFGTLLVSQGSERSTLSEPQPSTIRLGILDIPPVNYRRSQSYERITNHSQTDGLLNDARVTPVELFRTPGISFHNNPSIQSSRGQQNNNMAQKCQMRHLRFSNIGSTRKKGLLPSASNSFRYTEEGKNRSDIDASSQVVFSASACTCQNVLPKARCHRKRSVILLEFFSCLCAYI